MFNKPFLNYNFKNICQCSYFAPFNINNYISHRKGKSNYVPGYSVCILKFLRKKYFK